MKAVPAWLYFSVLRVLMFVVPLVVLLVLRIDPWVSTLLAAVIGLCLSYIFLRKPRENVARELYAARNRAAAPAASAVSDAAAASAASDDEIEDAAVDRAERKLESERQGQQDPVAEAGETGEFQRKNQLP
jgi:Protein of unknown function (DUF4229)